MDNKLILLNQTCLTLTGIKKAITLNETSLHLELENNSVQILGSNMEVKKLDVEAGVLEVVGTISQIKYVFAKEKLSVLKRIFK